MIDEIFEWALANEVCDTCASRDVEGSKRGCDVECRCNNCGRAWRLEGVFDE